MKISVVSLLLLSSASAFAGQNKVRILESATNFEVCQSFKAAWVSEQVRSMNIGTTPYGKPVSIEMGTWIIDKMNAALVEVYDPEQAFLRLSRDFQGAQGITVSPGSTESTTQIAFHPSGICGAVGAAEKKGALLSGSGIVQQVVDGLLEKSQAQ